MPSPASPACSRFEAQPWAEGDRPGTPSISAWLSSPGEYSPGAVARVSNSRVEPERGGGLLCGSLLRLGVRYNTQLGEQREQALRAEAAARDAQLRMLAYQLNPHFLFNTLNSIRALINEDRQRAREMVTALSGYLRYALVERPLHVALLEEEVASVRGYLAIEQVRFEERLDARMEIDAAALRCEVPAFLLNPLVRILARCPGFDHLVPWGSELPDFDVHAPLMSLPHLLGTTPGTIPAGRVSAHPSTHWDLFPTFAELAGAKTPAGLDGRSIARALGPRPAARRGPLKQRMRASRGTTRPWRLASV